MNCLAYGQTDLLVFDISLGLSISFFFLYSLFIDHCDPLPTNTGYLFLIYLCSILFSLSMPDLVFGTGGRFGRLSTKLASKLVFYAVDQGIQHFDTGYEYCHRRSQSLLFDIFSRNKYLLSDSLKISTKYVVPQKKGQLTALVNKSLAQLLSRGYLDTIFLWGPAISDTDSEFLLDELYSLKKSGKIRSWGVNTHSLHVMSHFLDRCKHFPFQHMMLDYNLLQQDREPLIKSFFYHNINVWAGTPLCQGFLSQSLFCMCLRTRSLSYLLRALVQPSTRRFLAPACVLRMHLKNEYNGYASSLPLAFVASNQFVSKIPVGMLSRSSIHHNISTLENLPSEDLIDEVSQWAYKYCQPL